MQAKVLVSLLLLFPLSVRGANPIPVTVASLESLLFYPTRIAPASIVTINDSKISAEVSAVIERIPVEVGQVVEPDTPMVELRQSDIVLAIREAETTMKSLNAQNQQANEQLQRVRSLARKQSVTAELLSKTETDVKVTAAELAGQQIRVEKLRQELNKTVARAPFNAIVVERIANVGELAMPGTPLVRVMDATNVEVVAELQPYDVPSLMQSNGAQFVTKNNDYAVHLKRIIPVIDERERSQEVRLEFDGDRALIGTSGHLSWRENSPYLPADFLVRRNGRLGVFVVLDHAAVFTEFPKAEEGRPALNILPLDSTVINDGRFVIREGQPIKIITENPDKPAVDGDTGNNSQAVTVKPPVAVD